MSNTSVNQQSHTMIVRYWIEQERRSILEGHLRLHYKSDGKQTVKYEGALPNALAMLQRCLILLPSCREVIDRSLSIVIVSRYV